MAWPGCGFARRFVSRGHVSLLRNDDELSQRRTTSGLVYSTRKIFGELTWSVDKKLKNLFCHLFHSFSFILHFFVTINFFLPGAKTGKMSQYLHGLKSYFFFAFFMTTIATGPVTYYLLFSLICRLKMAHGSIQLSKSTRPTLIVFQ